MTVSISRVVIHTPRDRFPENTRPHHFHESAVPCGEITPAMDPDDFDPEQVVATVFFGLVAIAIALMTGFAIYVASWS